MTRAYSMVLVLTAVLPTLLHPAESVLGRKRREEATEAIKRRGRPRWLWWPRRRIFKSTSSADAIDGRNGLGGKIATRLRLARWRGTGNGRNRSDDTAWRRRKRALVATTSASGAGRRGRCRDVIARTARRRPWWRRGQHLRRSYEMAVLSSMAYWKFDARGNVTGFRLLGNDHDNDGSRRNLRGPRGAIIAVWRHLCRSIHQSSLAASYFSEATLDTGTNSTARQQVYPPTESGKRAKERRYRFEYLFRDWHEQTKVPAVKWHDTDLLVSTAASGSGRDVALILTFAGTQSTADHLTNVQTFEPAAHSGLFRGSEGGESLEGSVHRGMLNAYSRVQRGTVIRLCDGAECGSDASVLRSTLHPRFGNCTFSKGSEKKKKLLGKNATLHDNSDNESIAITEDLQLMSNEATRDVDGDNSTSVKSTKMVKKNGCRVAGEMLMTILRQVIADALLGGREVHLTGHSLGGALATLCALDIVINFPHVPISKLHVWTFGAPQVTDETFVRSAVRASSRLRRFLRRGRFHRFVTLSDGCEADFVSNVASRALAPSSDGGNNNNLRGRTARRLGGARGGIVHLVGPYYLLPPPTDEQEASSRDATEDDGKPASATTTTRSSLAAHRTTNYLRGISRESRYHPLRTDFCPEVRRFIGEIPLEA